MISKSALILVVALLSSHARAINQSPVVCQSEFSWAQNEKGHNPCQVAAVVQGACDSNKWTVPALNSTHGSYAPPGYGTTKENECSCSWAAYNLISACAACQGYSLSVKNWANITLGPCQKQGFLGASYFPPSVPLSDQESIPSWASRDPSKWQDGRFNVDQAMTEAQTRKPDVRPWETKKESKTPIGAIAGGVVGGVLVIGLGAFLAWFFFFRRKLQYDDSSQSYTSGYGQQARPRFHGRSWSDLSAKSETRAMSHMPSPTIRTHSSTHSLGGTHFGSVAHLSMYPAQQQHQTPPMTRPVPQPTLSREEMISPFTLTRDQVSPTQPPNAHRKMNSDVSEMSNASLPVSRMTESDEEQIRTMGLSPSPSGRGRYNPPAYVQESPTNSMYQVASPVRRDPASPAHGHGHGHGRALRHQRSQESALSWEGTAGRALPTIQGSISSMREITGARGPKENSNIPIA